MDTNVSDEHVIHITGDKISSSLDKYRTLKANRKKEMSQIVSTTNDEHLVTQN